MVLENKLTLELNSNHRIFFVKKYKKYINKRLHQNQKVIM